MYSKEKFSVVIFLPRVLIYQKREISLPVGYKTARPKTGDWKWLWLFNSGPEASRETDFSVIFVLWANQFAKKWHKSALFIIKLENVGKIKNKKILITEALDKQLRIKISKNNLNDVSMIRLVHHFQILRVRFPWLLHILRMRVNVSLHVIKVSKMWNVKCELSTLNSFALIKSDRVLSFNFFS